MNGLHGIILAYVERTGLKELVSERCSASVPFGGRYRVIDYALSNLVNAGVVDVGVVTHSRYQSLLDHLGNGKAWDLSRKRGGLRFLPPFNVDKQAARPYRGDIEALASIRSYIDTIRQDYVVILDGDLVANLPLADVLDDHIKSGADITTVVANDCYASEGANYFEVKDGVVTEVLGHPKNPRGFRGLEVYIVGTELLKKLVDDCTARDEYSWRKHVLQAKKDLKLHAFIFDGFAAQIRTVQEFYDRNMQLLDPNVRASLYNPRRPMIAKSIDKPSAYIGPNGAIANSIIGDGSRVEGSVENSILFSGVTVEEGAVVKDSILFLDAVVRKDGSITSVICDKKAEITEGRELRGSKDLPLVVPKYKKV